MLSDRKRQILRAVVHDYVLTAEPVASRALSRRHQLNLSPATIRNELADLEEEGLLRQPHTSAGRIPSDTGYRVYVDTLMERNQLAPETLQVVERYQSLARDLPELLEQASRLTAVLSQCTALVRAPRMVRSRVRHVQLLPIGGDEGGTCEALLVLIMDRGMPVNQRLRLPSPLSGDELAYLTNFLNTHLRGRTLDELTRDLLDSLAGEVKTYQELLRELWMRLRTSMEGDRVYLSHASFLAQQPEFTVPGKVGALLNLLEREQMVANLLDHIRGEDRFAKRAGGTPDPAGQAVISIGEENPYPDLHECSVVTAGYGVDGEMVGEVAVVGPTRMAYATAVETVELMARQLSVSLNRLLGHV